MKAKGQQDNKMNAAEKTAQRFTEMMIKRIEGMKLDWHQPWVNKGFTGAPQNLSGRHYKGMNAIMLMLLREEMNWKTPVFMTFNQARTEGWNVKKGEKGFPVMLWKPVFRDENGNKLKAEEYDALSQEEKEKCTLRMVSDVHIVFNAEQTAMPELAPGRFAELTDRFAPGKLISNDGKMRSLELDYMLDKQTWVCPIELKHSDDAFYSPLKDKIVVPLKEQYAEGEKFYGTLLHEMAHSTGHESRLDRLKPGRDKADYAREELVAEMTAALTASILGIDKQIEDDNVAYLQYWLDQLKEKPDFIQKIMSDVNKASALIQEKVLTPEMAEEVKKEAMEKIDQFLEERQKVQDEVTASIPVMTEQQIRDAVPSIRTEKKEKEPQKQLLPEGIIEAVKSIHDRKGPETMALITGKDGQYYMIGDNAAKVEQILGLPAEDRLTVSGEVVRTVRMDAVQFDAALPKLIRQGLKIAVGAQHELNADIKTKMMDGFERVAEHRDLRHPGDIALIKLPARQGYVTFGNDAMTLANITGMAAVDRTDSQGRTTKMLHLPHPDIDQYMPAILNAGETVHLYTERDVNKLQQKASVAETGKQEAQTEKTAAPTLHYGYTGNGLNVWEDGDESYTAHISEERELKINKVFHPDNVNKLQKMADSGNIIVGQSHTTKGFLALNPLNMPERFIKNRFESNITQLSLEQVGGRQLVCHGRRVIEEGSQWQNYAKIQRPEEFLVNVKGMQNVIPFIDRLQKSNENMDMQNHQIDLEDVKQKLMGKRDLLKPYEREIKASVFHIRKVHTPERDFYAVRAMADSHSKLDPDNKLPRYFYKDGTLQYNKPSALDMKLYNPERRVLAEDSVIRIKGKQHLLSAAEGIRNMGVNMTNEMSTKLTELYENNKARIWDDSIYLYIHNGVAEDLHVNIVDWTIDEPLYDYQAGQLMVAETSEAQYVANDLFHQQGQDSGLKPEEDTVSRSPQNIGEKDKQWLMLVSEGEKVLFTSLDSDQANQEQARQKIFENSTKELQVSIYKVINASADIRDVLQHGQPQEIDALVKAMPKAFKQVSVTTNTMFERDAAREKLQAAVKIPEEKNEKLPEWEWGQYETIKAKHPDCVLLMKNEGVYHAVGQDAEKVAQVIDKPLSKAMFNGKEVPSVTFPVHQLDGVIPKLIAAAIRVAICDNLEKPQRQVDQQEKEIITNPKNNMDMAKKKQEDPQVENKVDEQPKQTTAQQQENGEKKQLREGVHVFAMREKGLYGVNIVKDGQRGETALISKEDRDQYFKDVKGKTGQDAEEVRKALAAKYFTPEGVKIKTVSESANQQQKPEAQKAYSLPKADDSVRARIEDPKVFKMQNGNYGVRAIIDGEQQLTRPVSQAKISAFFDGFKGMDKESQAAKRQDLVAAVYSDVLRQTKEERQQSQGMSR